MGCTNIPCGKEPSLSERTVRKESLIRWVKPKMSNFLPWHKVDPLPEMEEGKGSGKKDRFSLLHSPHHFLFPLPFLRE